MKYRNTGKEEAAQDTSLTEIKELWRTDRKGSKNRESYQGLYQRAGGQRTIPRPAYRHAQVHTHMNTGTPPTYLDPWKCRHRYRYRHRKIIYPTHTSPPSLLHTQVMNGHVCTRCTTTCTTCTTNIPLDIYRCKNPNIHNIYVCSHTGICAHTSTHSPFLNLKIRV